MELKLAILDALSDDFESITQKQNYLLFLDTNISSQEIISMLNLMISEEIVFINGEICDEEFIWYGITEKGTAMWENEF